MNTMDGVTSNPQTNITAQNAAGVDEQVSILLLSVYV